MHDRVLAKTFSPDEEYFFKLFTPRGRFLNQNYAIKKRGYHGRLLEKTATYLFRELDLKRNPLETARALVRALMTQ